MGAILPCLKHSDKWKSSTFWLTCRILSIWRHSDPKAGMIPLKSFSRFPSGVPKRPPPLTNICLLSTIALEGNNHVWMLGWGRSHGKIIWISLFFMPKNKSSCHDCERHHTCSGQTHCMPHGSFIYLFFCLKGDKQSPQLYLKYNQNLVIFLPFFLQVFFMIFQNINIA